MKIKFRVPLHTQILIGLFLGFIVGFLFPEFGVSIKFVGDLFLRALKMIIIPLLFTSIVSGVISLGEGARLKTLAFKTIAWYLTTSVLAILTGLVLVNIIKPGVGIELPNLSASVEKLKVTDLTLQDFVMRMIPENVFNAMAQGKMLPTIVFSLLFGMAILGIPTYHQKTLVNFFNASFEAMMKLTNYIILLTPYGIFGLIAGIVGKYAADLDHFLALLSGLSKYMITVLGGLFIHAFITIPLLIYLFTRFNAYKYMKRLRLVFITAFSTSSSSATMPTTIKCLEEEANVPNRYTSFVIPLGATINMDGTALYECVAALFVAQLYGIDLSFGQQVLVVLTSLLASIGAAGVPMAGLIMMTVVFSVVGLPLEGIGIVLTVDRILDMFRTTVNVWSDMSAAIVIAKNEEE